MENNGSRGSKGAHFEQLFTGDEMMVAKEVPHSSFSALSLAVAADSGWYDIDLSIADEYSFGKNRGCGIFTKKCKNSPILEFCDIVNRSSCGDDLNYISVCKKSKYTGNCYINLRETMCKIPRPSSGDSSRYGRNSICQNCRVSVNKFF
jgi:leishmanolysin